MFLNLYWQSAISSFFKCNKKQFISFDKPTYFLAKTRADNEGK